MRKIAESRKPLAVSKNEMNERNQINEINETDETNEIGYKVYNKNIKNTVEGAK